jgi:gliding motility-associated-like protein
MCRITLTLLAVCQDITVNLLGNGTVSINPGEVDGGSFDNCATYTYVGVTPSTFDCDDIGPNPVTLTVVDNSGNTSSCTATVTVQDLIAPIALCQDITVSLDTNGMVMIDPAQIDNGSTDNCGVVNLDTLAPSAFTCDNIGGNLVTLTISDESDNVSTCTAIVTVEDNEPPVAGCQDITVQLDDFTGTITITPDQVENGSVDNCSPVVTPVSVTPDFFECGLIGPNIVELTVEDDFGNSSTCTATVTVEDVTPPLAVCFNATVYIGGDGTASITPQDVDGGSFDNCGVITLDTVAPSLFDCSNVGSNMVTLFVSDPYGNTSTCMAFVTVADTIPPVAVCQDITVQLDENGTEAIAPEDVENGSTDNCGQAITADAVTPNIFDCTNIGDNIVELTISDNFSNTATCTATVTVQDTLPPVALCQDVTVALDASGNASVTVDDIDNGSNDNCGNTTLVSVDPATFGCTEVGDNTVTLLVEDAEGNQSSCTATVSVQDTIAPVITCPPTTILTSTLPIQVSDLDPAVSDNCSADSLSLAYELTGATVDTGDGDASGTFFNPGTTEVTYTLTDGSGNSASCSFMVIVNPIDPPTIVCPADTSVFTNGTDCTVTVNTGLDVTIDSDPGLVDSIYYVLTGASSGEGSPSANGAEFEIGMTTVTYFVTDTFMNIANCSFTVTVLDTVPPVVLCPTPEAVVNDPGLCSALIPNLIPDIEECEQDSVKYILSGATTASGLGIPTNVSFNVGLTTLTYEVVDESGNTGTCSVDVTVLDGEGPVVSCPADVVVSTAMDTCGAVLNNLDVTATDNCDAAIAVLSYTIDGATQGSGSLDASGSFFDIGVSTITYLATDSTGNTGSCSFTVTVEDMTPPMLSCPGNQLIIVDQGDTSAIVNDIALLDAVDNCTEIADTNYVLVNGIDTIATGMADASGNEFPVGITAVTYVVTDTFGNVASCSFNVVVLEGNNLDIECPMDTTIVLDTLPCETIVDNISLMINEDSVLVDTVIYTLNGATVGSGSGDASGTSFGVGTTTVTYTVLDTLGVPSVCSFDVTVIDSIAPIITCPDSTLYNTDQDLCGVTVSGLTATVEECSDFTLTYELSGATLGTGSADTSQITFNTGFTEVTLTATDANGLSSSCTYTVEVIDAQAPEVSCIGDTTLSNDPGLCSAVLDTFGIVDTFDNCGISSILYNYTGATNGSVMGDTSGIAFNVGVTEVEIIVSDAAGNQDSCSFTVTVLDDKAPGFECPSDFTISTLLGDSTAQVFVDPDVADNCGVVDTSFTLSGATTGSGSGILDTLFNAGATTVTYIATDASGNTTECVFVVTVELAVEVEIACPADTVVNTEPGLCGATVNDIDVEIVAGAPGVDNIFYLLSGATVGIGGNGASGTFFNTGNTLLTYNVIDVLGDTLSCSFEVSVLDNELPTLTCPDDINTTTDPDTCGAVITWSTPVVSDNCPGVNLSSDFDSGDFFPTGNTVVTYTATDGSGNTATCSFNVLVEDNIPPVVECSNDLIFYTTADTCGMTVNDIAPVLTENCSLDTVFYTLAGATIGSGQDDASGTFFGSGITTVTYTAVDDSDNTGICQFNVQVIDTIPPSLECPEDVIVFIPDGQTSTVINDIAPVGVDDNCGILSVSYFLTGATSGNGQNDASGTVFNLGVTVVNYAVNDTEGNFVNCSFLVTVNPEINYELDCPSNVLAYSGADTCGTVVENIGLVVLNDSGNLSDTMYTLSAPTNISGTGDASGNFFELSVTTVSYTVMDIFGNTGSCIFDVVVIDTISPEIVCPPDLTIFADGDCEAVATWDPAVATDNCGIFTESCDFNSGDSFPLGTTTVTCTATDDSGNTANCSFTVTVLDTVPPVISCPADLTVNTDAGLCSAVVNNIGLTFDDNCSLDTVFYQISGATLASGGGDASGTNFFLGTSTVSYTAIDASGNESTCSFTVTVEDTELPEIECPSDTMISTQIGQITVQAILPPDAVGDNCGVASYGYTLSGTTTGSGSGDVNEVFNIGVTVVTYTVTDNAGNTNTCSFEVFVVYDAIPKVECPNNMTVVNDEGLCSTVLDSLFFEVPALDSAFLDTAYHELMGATVGTGPWDASGTAFNVGITEIVYHVIDTFGNEGTCDFSITVLDVEDPIIECPDTLELVNDPGLCSALVDTLAPISFSDNCGIDSSFYVLSGATTGTGEDLFNQAFNVGMTMVSFTIIDPSGNAASCAFPVIVSDEEAPEIECVNDTTLYTLPGNCSGELCDFVAQATDNCGINSILYTLDGATTGSGTNEVGCLDFNEGVTTVTWFAYDAANNVTTCSFDVTVIDTIAPVLDCPSDGEANTVAEQCFSITELQLPDVFESCGVEEITYTLTGATEESGVLEPGTEVQFNLDTTFVNYLVTDVNGNTSACSYSVVVIDDEAPSVFCPADTVITTEPGACTAVVGDIAPDFFENCTVDTLFYTLESGGMMVGSGANDASGETFELGTTTVSYIIVDQSGNTDTCSFDVTLEQGALTLSIDPDTVVCEGVDIIFSSNATPGLDSISWTGPANFMSNVLEPGIDSVTLNNAGTYTATFYYPDGCTADASIELTVLDQPDVDAATEDLFCTDGTEDVTLEGILNGNTEIDSWAWFDENGMQIDSKQDHLIAGATSDDSGTYTVVAVSVDGCTDTATVELLVTDKPAQPSLINDCDNFLCLDETCLLIGEEYSPEPEAYIWTADPFVGAGLNDTITSNITSVRPTVAGTYTYTYAVVFDGCESDPATVELTVISTPVIEDDNYLMDINTSLEDFDVYENDDFNFDIPFDLEVTTSVEHGELINNGDGTFTYTPDRGFIGVDQFVYRVCYDECNFCDFAVVTIRVAYPSDECVIPTIITPNGDNVNDLLIITCLEDGTQYPNNELLIFNQWGDEVFRAAPYENDWDGTYEGNDLPDGVYFYIFKTGETGIDPQKGSVTIFR